LAHRFDRPFVGVRHCTEGAGPLLDFYAIAALEANAPAYACNGVDDQPQTGTSP
jgi:hypothetical protein